VTIEINAKRLKNENSNPYFSIMLEIIDKKEQERILDFQHQGYHLIDLTSSSKDAVYCKFHPSYPHGDVPFPEFPNHTSQSVEGIWEGLKHFETTGIDAEKFHCKDPNNLKRTEEMYGKYLGHRYGANTLLNEQQAFEKIYKPLYTWQIQVKLQKEFKTLKEMYQNTPMVWIVDDVCDAYILLLLSFL